MDTFYSGKFIDFCSVVLCVQVFSVINVQCTVDGDSGINQARLMLKFVAL